MSRLIIIGNKATSLTAEGVNLTLTIVLSGFITQMKLPDIYL